MLGLTGRSRGARLSGSDTHRASGVGAVAQRPTSPPDRTPASHHPRKVLDSSVTTPAYSPPPAGTRRLPNVPPGAYVGDDAEVVNGELFFYAANALWRSDTTPQGTHPLDTGSGAASYASGIELAGNTLFFAGEDDGATSSIQTRSAEAGEGARSTLIPSGSQS